MANVITRTGMGTAAANLTANTTLAVPYATAGQLTGGLLVGDAMVIHLFSSNATAPSLPTGFTSAAPTTNSGGSSPSLRSAVRIATSADVTHSTNGDSLSCATSSSTSQGWMEVYRSVDGSAIIDVTGVVFGTSSTVATFDDTGLTTSRPGCAVIYAAAANSVSGTFSPPTNYTEDRDLATITPKSTSGHRIWTGVGPTGTITVTPSASVRGCMTLIALRPASASTTRSTTWNTKASVSLSRATTWNVLTQVAAVTRATTWRVLAAVSTSRLTTWRTLAQAVTTRATTWRALASATVSRATTWRTLATATTSRATTWRTLAAATTSRATTWRVLKSVSTARSTTWNVTGRIVKTISTTWNTKASVSTTRSTSWNVFTSVGKQVSTTWRTLAPAGTSRATTWNIKAAVRVVRSTTWNIKGQVTLTRVATWRVLKTVNTKRKTYWNVFVLPPLVPNPRAKIGHNDHAATLVANQHTGVAVDAVGQGDTLTDWQCVLSDGSSPYDATGADSVTVKGYRNDVLLINRAPDNVDPDGTITLAWVDGETDDPGPIKFKVIVTKSGFKPATFPPQGWMVTRVHPTAP